MVKKELKTFVRELVANITNDVIAKIDEGRVPETWDGHELRCMLAARFEDACYGTAIRRHPRHKRAREYRNAMIVNNL